MEKSVNLSVNVQTKNGIEKKKKNHSGTKTTSLISQRLL